MPPISELAQFGFAGLLVLLGVFGMGWGFRRIFNMIEIHVTDQRAADKAEKERVTTAHVQMIDAQRDSFHKHTEVSQGLLENSREVTTAIKAIQNSAEIQARLSEKNGQHLESIEHKADRLHQAFRDGVDVLIELIPDKPNIQNQLRRIKNSVD